MFPRSLLLALSAVPLAGEHVPVRPISHTTGCSNAILHEPLLIYEVHGGTLVGPVDLHVVVYSDGFVRLTNATDPEAPEARVVRTDPEAVSDLMLDLERCGSMIECDAVGQVTDVPLQTLTVLRPGTDVRGHTFSWWLPDGTSAAVESRIEQFLADLDLR